MLRYKVKNGIKVTEKMPAKSGSKELVMKRAICAVLAFIMLLSLSACGRSAEAKAVDELIKQIGTVTLDSENAIIAAETAFSMLTEEQKSEVRRYEKLRSCRAYYEYLLTVCDYNESAEEYNSVITGYNGKVSTFDEEYNAYNALVDRAETLDAAGPAYDESTKEEVLSEVSAAADYFKLMPEKMTLISLLSPTEMGNKKADSILEMIEQLKGMKYELENMVTELTEKADGITGGGELLDKLRKGLESFAESISTMKSIKYPEADRVESVISSLSNICDVEQGTYATGHNGSVFFRISPEYLGDTSGQYEYKGTVEIYESSEAAAAGAEKLGAMNEIMGSAFAKGIYLIRFNANVPEDAARDIADRIFSAINS